MDTTKVLLIFLLLGFASGFVNDLNDDFEDHFETDEIEKRQTWSAFQNKHVVIASFTVQNANAWNNLAQIRLGPFYGASRPTQTFIRVSNLNDVINGFTGNLEHCTNHPAYWKSNSPFDLIHMRWGFNDRYSVTYLGSKHICVALENGRPVHFAGYE